MSKDPDKNLEINAAAGSDGSGSGEILEAANAAKSAAADTAGNGAPVEPTDAADSGPVSAEKASADIAADMDSVMRKFDRESNTRIWTGVPQKIIQYITAFFSLYCIFATLFSKQAIQERLSIFLCFVIIIGFLYYPISKKHSKPNHIPWYDILIMIAGAGAFLYYYIMYDSLVFEISSAAKVTPFYAFIGIIGILVLAELCRRCVGLPILCVVTVLLIYTFAKGITYTRVLHTLFYQTSGVLGTPAQVCAKYIVVFIIFGAFLEKTGISAFFIDLANSLFGSMSGGPAKVAVVSSALCGMVSGSSVGNTVTTGSITIPMMKRTGYKPEFAGAVEAASSTGGQIMPPIMGAAAFLMAEYMGIGYGQVALKAIIPAFLYFLGIFIAVHLEAKKLKLVGIPRVELPKFTGLLPKFYLLLPLVVLVVMVATNARTMQFSASIAIIVAILVSLPDKNTRMTPRRFIEALEAGGKGTITVAVACAMAGIIAGCITVTGLASKLINAIVTASGDTLIIGLFLTMLCCIVLGMGVPTTANYCIMASTCAPILIQMGLPVVCAHFFVFYFGIVADITPPVALAAYAGAAIAKANPMKTGINATKLAIAAFIVPYIFAYNPVMLLEGATALDVIQIVITSIIGLFAIAAALNGHLFCKINVIFRILFAVGGLLMMIPGTATDLAGLAVIVVLMIIQKSISKKQAAAA